MTKEYEKFFKELKVKKKNIYVNIAHSNYWWGIYNFEEPTSWEDIIIYEKKGKGFRKLAWTCICSSSYLSNSLEDLKDDDDEKEFVYEVEQFLNNNKITYHYYYDKPDADDFFEVPYEAQRNSLNIKPSSIETWYPCKGIDKNVVDTVIKQFCNKFLDIEVDNIIYKEIVSKFEALESYMEFQTDMQRCTGMSFSDELIQKVKKELNVSEEKVMEILRRSLK